VCFLGRDNGVSWNKAGRVLKGFLHRNRLAALGAQEDVNHVEFGEFVPELAARIRDAENVASAIGHGFQCLRFLLDVRSLDRFAALLAELSSMSGLTALSVPLCRQWSTAMISVVTQKAVLVRMAAGPLRVIP
jgi:hypothetical protein